MGKNRDASIKLALTDMISKLGIKIESTYESNEQLKHNYATKTIKNQVKSSIAAIKINNYNVVESERISYNQFAVLLKTDKLKLASSLKETLDRKRTELLTSLSAVQESNILTKYNTTEKVAQDAKVLLSDVLIIKEIDPTYSGVSALDFIENVNTTFIMIKKELNFKVSGDKESSEFVTVFENHLTKSGYTLSQQANANTVKIQVSTSINRTNSSSIKIVIFDIKVKAINASEQIGGKTLIIKLRKSGNMTTLYKNAAIQFSNELKGQDINALLQIKK